MRLPGTRRGLADVDRRNGSHLGWALLAGGAMGALLVWLLRERRVAPGIDLVAIQNIVLEMTGNADVEVRHLGDGIVELVGKVETPAHAQTLIETLSDAPGVLTVLDRLWVRPPRLVS